jgi:hypothetical protein
MGFRAFEKEDWYGMAGASKFEDESEPLVNYDITVDGLDAYAVIDGSGFYLAVLSPDGDIISETATEPDAIPVFRFLAARKDSFETGELYDMGIELARAEGAALR